MAKSIGREEGWNCNVRKWINQQKIDRKRARRRKKMGHKFGDYVKYRGVH